MTALRSRPVPAPRGPDLDRQRRRRRGLRISALVLTAVVLITLDFRGSGGLIGGLRDGTLEVLSPVRSFGGWLTSPVRNAWKGVTDYEDVIDENARLRDELDAAQADVLAAGDLRRELDALAAEVALRPPGAVRQVVARVIDAPVSSFDRTIELDEGSSRGIAVGMPVVTGGGLLGRIAQVSDSRSRVELVTDPDVSVGVRLVRSGDFGATRGQGLNRTIEVDLISLDTPVLLGESVVTSGLQGSAYPEGLLVGTVVGVRPEPVADSQALELEPAVDAERVRFATVLLFEPEPAPPPPTTAPAATVPATPEDGTGIATTTAAPEAPTSASISTVTEQDETAP